MRNIVQTGNVWNYLILDDFNKKQEITNDELSQIDYISKTLGISYLLYKTKRGFHYIGLTATNSIAWGEGHFNLHRINQGPHRYHGQSIRLTKQNEKMELIRHELNNGLVILNLYNLFRKRLNLKESTKNNVDMKMVLIFEKQ